MILAIIIIILSTKISYKLKKIKGVKESLYWWFSEAYTSQSKASKVAEVFLFTSLDMPFKIMHKNFKGYED